MKSLEKTSLLPALAWTLMCACNPVHNAVRTDAAISDLPQPSFELERRQDDDIDVVGATWSFLADPAFEMALKEALKQNLSLAQVSSRLKGAAAARDGADASLWPTLDLTATRSKSESFIFGRTIAQDQWGLSTAASYEVDVFDRLGSLRRSAALEYQATKEDLLAARITVTANFADTWFQHIEAQKAMVLYQEQRQTSRAYFALTETRFAHGLATAADVLQQRQQLEATENRENALWARVQLTAHQLQVLAGKIPSSATLRSDLELPKAMRISTLDLNAKIIGNRPDLQAARLRIHAVDERVAAALANRLPAFRLSGNVGLGAQSFSELFDQWLFGITTSMIAPIFDGGRRAAEVAQQRAALEQALAQYRALYIGAIKEVRDALVLAQQEDERHDKLLRELATAKDLLGEVKRRYTRGVGPYISVLNALQTLQMKERELLASKRTQLTHRISLWRAIGGVYDDESRAEAPKERQR